MIKNSVFMNNVLPTSWYGGEAVRLWTVPGLVISHKHVVLVKQ